MRYWRTLDLTARPSPLNIEYGQFDEDPYNPIHCKVCGFFNYSVFEDLVGTVMVQCLQCGTIYHINSALQGALENDGT